MRAHQNAATQRKTRGRMSQFGTRARVGLLTAPTMDFGGMGDVEWMMFQERVTLAPISCEAEAVPIRSALTVLPTAGLDDIEGGKLAGVIAPGHGETQPNEAQTAFDKLVNVACAEAVPVMAFGDGVPRALEAMGFEPPADLPPALLVHNGLRILDTQDEVRDALMVFHAAQSRLAA